jgi:hypothetical protein
MDEALQSEWLLVGNFAYEKAKERNELDNRLDFLLKYVQNSEKVKSECEDDLFTGTSDLFWCPKCQKAL